MAVETVELFRAAPSLRLTELRYPGARFHHFCVADESGAIGNGGGETADLAQRRALFEWIERRLFRLHGDATSSGWAAHGTREDAQRAAEFELLERDAILVSWLCQISPAQLAPRTFPAFEEKTIPWRFGKGPGFVIVGALLAAAGERIFLSAAAASEQEALAKLDIDSERARALLGKGGPSGALAPHHHAINRANEEAIAWLYESGRGLRYDDSLVFEHRVFHAPLWNGTDAYVVEARSQALQPLYYGTGSLPDLRRSRLRSALPRGQRLNRMRHPLL